MYCVTVVNISFSEFWGTRVIELQDIYVKMAELKKSIEEKIRHPYLMKHIQTPALDEDKILLLCSIFDHIGLGEKERQYALTTMLVQVALDTHDAVSNTPLPASGPDEKERQLTVLAGDYYSGLYYYLLAEIDDVPMIINLAKAIQLVNENKIKVYQKDIGSLKDLMESLKMIEGSLLIKITDYFQLPEWRELSAQMLLYKRLAQEKKLYMTARHSGVFDILKKFAGGSIESVLAIVDSAMEDCLKGIQEAKGSLKLNEAIKVRMNELAGTAGYFVKKIAEEG